MSKQSDDLTWHEGPPPSLGWWPASYADHDDVFRWWDGRFWSYSAGKSYSAIEAAYVAEKKETTGLINWQHRPASWPARSRT